MPESFGDFLARCMRTVDEHGHGIIYVGPGDGEHGFSYTYGLALEDRPDLLLDGSLAPETAKAILNGAADAGVTAPGEYDGVLRDLKVRAVPVNAEGLEQMSVARVFGGSQTQALQILWPDPEQRYPGDEGYDPERWPQKVYAEATP